MLRGCSASYFSGDIMTETEKIIAHILDLKEKCATESIIVSSNFLSVDEISHVIKTERINNQYVDTFYYGGYDDAERKLVVFVPKFYEIEKSVLIDFLNENDYNPIQVLDVKKDKFSNLSHRDYLGALMGLGIKREVLGDIVVNENGCTIFCLKSITDYLTENFNQAGRGQLTVSLSDINSFGANESKTETTFISVASLRLDCLVAAAFRTSRTVASEAIIQGLIYVNGEQITKNDYNIRQGDKLVFRGRGKTVVDEILGENKKGRIHLNIKRYL